LGLCASSLRTLGLYGRRLGMDSRSSRNSRPWRARSWGRRWRRRWLGRAPCLRSSARRLYRWRGFSASITIGSGVAGVAWVALGPADVWVPGYHVSAAYMTNVNVSNSTVVNRTQVTNIYTTTVINNNTTVNVAKVVYANQAAPGAVTAVPQEAFEGGKPVAPASVKMTSEQISSPKVVSARPVAPTPQSVAGVARPAAASARPPATLATHPVVTKMAPSARAVPVGHSAPLTATAYKPA